MARQDTRGSTPTVAKIHEHWLKKVQEDPHKWVGMLGDYQYENIVVGEGKCCYACGVEVSGNLPRAHIVPHSLGGSSAADNLFLLCRLCHKENPDTIYPDMFFDYVKNRDSHLIRWWNAYWLPMKAICSRATVEEQALFDSVFQHEGAAEKVRDEYTKAILRDATIAGGIMSSATQSALMWKTFLKVGAELSCRTELAA